MEKTWNRKDEMEKFLDFLLRIVVGMLVIYFVNSLLSRMGFSTIVGINGISVLTCGFLGFPGLVALYGFGFYKVL